MVKTDQLCACTHEGFTQNGFYVTQPHPSEVVFHSTDADTSCSFAKKDLTFKQGHRVSFCFLLCNILS